MKALTKILGFAAAALIGVALAFYFIEVYAPSPANPTLSAAIQQDSIPIGSMTREFLEYVPYDISPIVSEAVLTRAIPAMPIVIMLALQYCIAEAEAASAVFLSMTSSVITMGVFIALTR